LPPFQIVVAYGPAIANKKKGVDEFAATLREGGTRAEVVDARHRSAQQIESLMTEFGAAGDPVSATVVEFIQSVDRERHRAWGANACSNPKAKLPTPPPNSSKLTASGS